ncbi:MAG: AraC family transcriptional regulator [Clostridium sp.]|nr:AraC family transcriptional regulator [Clostridium sp.]
MDYQLLRRIKGFSARVSLLGVDLHVNNISYYNQTDVHFFHYHEFSEIIYVLSGEIKVGIGTEIVTVREHEILYMGGNIRHKLKIYPDIPVECLTMSFELTYALQDSQIAPQWIREEQELVKTLMSSSHGVTEDKGSCIRIIDDICEGIGEGTVGEYSKLKNHLGNLFICTLQAFGNNRKRLEEDAAREVDFVNKAIQINDYIGKNFTRELTLQSVADELNYSTRQLQRIIKLYYNISFRELLIQYRVGYSKVLLGLTPHSLEVVAGTCGFSSLKSFEKYFKLSEGMTPSAFKKIYGKCNS